MPRKWAAASLLVTTLVVGAALRLHRIDQPFIDGFSWREASTAMMAENFYRTSWNVFYPEVNWNGPGPGYGGREFQTVSYLTALLYLVTGQRDWVGRSVAVAFGLWGIVALHGLIRRCWDREHAIAGAAVLAVLPGSVFVDRSFLPDPAMVALITTSLWMLAGYLQDHRRAYLAAATFFGMWGCLTKLTGLIAGVPATYLIVILTSGTPGWSRRRAPLVAAAFTVLIPVIAYYSWARHLSLTYPPFHFAGDGFWIWNSGVRDWWNHRFFVPGLVTAIRAWLWTGPGAALVLLGMACPPPTHRRERCMFHWWLGGILVFVAIGAHELYANAWNLHIVNPAAAAFAGRGILVIGSRAARIAGSISPRTSRAPLRLATIVLLLVALMAYGQRVARDVYEPPTWHVRQSYELGLALERLSALSDLVVTLAYALGDPVAMYYSRRRGWVFTSGDGPPYPEQAIDDAALPSDDRISIAKIESLRRRGATWLGIVGVHQDDIRRRHPMLRTYLDERWQPAEETHEWAVYRTP